MPKNIHRTSILSLQKYELTQAGPNLIISGQISIAHQKIWRAHFGIEHIDMRRIFLKDK